MGEKIDAVKIGLLCIAAISILVGVCGLIWGGDKKVEIALAAMNGASMIGGWLGHAVISGRDTGTSETPKEVTKP